MSKTYTSPKGANITQEGATLCFPDRPDTSPMHDFLYLGKEDGRYKCKRCHQVFSKESLKYLLDEEDTYE